MNPLFPAHIRVTQLSDEGPIPSFFIRFRDPIASLTNNWNFIRSDSPDADRIVAAAHVLVVQRAYSIRSKRLMVRARAAGILTIYETDDFLLELPPQSDFKISEKEKDAVRFMIAAADVVTCSTSALAERLGELNQNVRVIENYAVSVAPAVIRSARDTSPHVCIVNTDYFKLTEARDQLFAALHEAIERRGYRCSCFGSIDPLMVAMANAFPSKVHLDPSFTPWRKNFLQRLLARGVNVALVPLEIAPYHRFKSDVKFDDFASLEVPGIYNSPQIYCRVVHGQNGFVCKATYQGWLDGLDYFADESNRTRCGQAAYRDAAKRTSETFATELAAVIQKYRIVGGAVPNSLDKDVITSSYR